jgi:hypothetical protein
MVDLRISNPHGSGEIIDWAEAYCKQCDIEFVDRVALFRHIVTDRSHRRSRHRRRKRKHQQTLEGWIG